MFYFLFFKGQSTYVLVFLIARKSNDNLLIELYIFLSPTHFRIILFKCSVDTVLHLIIRTKYTVIHLIILTNYTVIH